MTDKYDCGLIKLEYIEDGEIIPCTGKEISKQSKQEILCYFKGGLCKFIPIKKLRVTLNGKTMKLGTAINEKKITLSSEKDYIKISK